MFVTSFELKNNTNKSVKVVKKLIIIAQNNLFDQVCGPNNVIKTCLLLYFMQNHITINKLIFVLNILYIYIEFSQMN